MAEDQAAGSGQPDALDYEPDALEYKEVTEPDFGASAADAFSVVSIRGGVILRGSCPRCGDLMEFPYVERVYRGLGGQAQQAGQLGVVQMVCTCTAQHPRRPEGEEGCGAYWNVVLQ